MRLPWRLVCAALPLLGAGDALADRAAVVAAAYGNPAVSPPTRERVVVCHGFNCKYRTPVALTAADRARLSGLLASGRASAKGERSAVAAAGAWFDRRIAQVAGTRNHVARAGYEYSGDRKQF